MNDTIPDMIDTTNLPADPERKATVVQVAMYNADEPMRLYECVLAQDVSMTLNDNLRRLREFFRAAEADLIRRGLI